MIQSVLPPPPMSCRVKMSPMILNSRTNQITQAKKTSIDQKTPRNG